MPSPNKAKNEQHKNTGMPTFRAVPPELIPLPQPAMGLVPSDAQCDELCTSYAMPDHIRAHSHKVAEAATDLALRAEEKGLLTATEVQAVRASALLHDLGKMYCIEHGGHHAQLGAVWVQAETGNPAIAQGVLHHVWWPFDVDPTRYFLPLVVLYADKRVTHDGFVSLGGRFTDLFERYAKTALARERITICMDQAKAVEHTLSELLGVKLHAYTFDRGRLVD
ncbi:HD domain-containing protein [Desulfovibrio ferrophilus]|uniref:Metal dependent phosphohydrolase n=1 Tax=Desulfovibrio ferrophilus TaxID=241368 RepID=A0A2Z6AXM6_9BACT|nr:HD domain-containing protein [Desulfovibrio ferrophilus]BBD07991.1 metal dependent phosphohydrolase [Desulfovibrio ferrophilus]